ncbi:MAG TPA: hypothetical protein VEI03_16000 [Stellaceae bacterium]|nr:hypothetical protein [Stellaceae bacterium]
MATPSTPDGTGTVHAAIAMRAGTLALRDAVAEDADAYVTYWHDSGDRIINLLGINKGGLGTAEDSRKRFLGMMRVPGTTQRSVVFTVTLNGARIGYTNLNMNGPDDNYPHFHTYLHTHRPLIRAAVAGSGRRGGAKDGYGIAAVVLGPLFAMHFSLFPIRRLIIQTRPAAHAINRALDLYLPPAETTHIDRPNGLALPGAFHMRYVHREDAARMLERAHALAQAG